MTQKELFERLNKVVDALNIKVDKLQEQVNAKTASPFTPSKPKNKQKDEATATEVDKNLWAATRKNYSDVDFKNALKFFNEFEGRPLTMKQLAWITYYAGQNHPNCQVETETFIKNELKKRTDYAQAKQDLINCINQSYSKYQSHTAYYKGVLNWLNSL